MRSVGVCCSVAGEGEEEEERCAAVCGVTSLFRETRKGRNDLLQSCICKVIQPHSIPAQRNLKWKPENKMVKSQHEPKPDPCTQSALPHLSHSLRKLGKSGPDPGILTHVE